MGVWNRIRLIWRSRNIPKVDYLAVLKSAISRLEVKANNAQVSLSRVRAREQILRGDAQGCFDKIAALERKMSEVNETERAGLETLRKQFEAEALGLGAELDAVEQRRAGLEQGYRRMLGSLNSIRTRGEELEARWHTAEASRGVYESMAGLDSKDGRNPLELLLEDIRRAEAQGESAMELTTPNEQWEQRLRKEQ